MPERRRPRDGLPERPRRHRDRLPGDGQGQPAAALLQAPGRRPAGAGASRGTVRLRHRRPAVHRRALQSVLRADRLLLRRRDGRGRHPAADHAAVQHQLGHRPPGRPRAGREGVLPGPGGRLPRLLHQRRVGGGGVGLEARPRALRRARSAAAPQGHRPQGRLPRRHPRRVVVHRHPQVQGRLRPGPDRGQPRQQHQPVPGPRRRRPGRLLRPAAGRGRAGRAGRRSGRGGADHRRAGAERGRLDHPAAGLLDRAAGDRRPLRHPADGRRGDHRVRPDRRVLRQLPRGRGPGPDQRGQGADVGVRPDGRRARPLQGDRRR